jgi:hypothetical protein
MRNKAMEYTLTPSQSKGLSANSIKINAKALAKYIIQMVKCIMGALWEGTDKVLESMSSQITHLKASL